MEACPDYKTYAKNMRSCLSDPNMYKADLSFNQQFFNTKKGEYWSQEDSNALIKGLSRDPVGSWAKINEEQFGGKVDPSSRRSTRPSWS